MVSLCYQNLLHYVTEDNLPGLQNFLENKRILVDDKDEVRIEVKWVFLHKTPLFFEKEVRKP